MAQAYLEFLFTDAVQEQVAKDGYRPYKPEILARHSDRLKPLNLFPVTAIARDWSDANQKFFAENGIVDTIFTPKGRKD